MNFFLLDLISAVKIYTLKLLYSGWLKIEQGLEIVKNHLIIQKSPPLKQHPLHVHNTE